MTILDESPVTVDSRAASTTDTPSRLFTPKELCQAVTNAEFDFKRRAIKVALRSARYNEVNPEAWWTLAESGDFVPTDYLPRERFKAEVLWSINRRRDYTGDSTPEALIAHEDDIPELIDFLDVDAGHDWSFEDMQREIHAQDIEQNGAYVGYLLVVTYRFTADYTGPLMDGGIARHALGEEILTTRHGGGRFSIVSFEPLHVDAPTPPQDGPDDDDGLDLGMFFTDAQVQARVDARIDELKHRVADLGMEGKAHYNWCGQAEQTLREIGIPDSYFELGYGSCDCEDCTSRDEEEDEPTDVEVEFVVTRTIRVRARRIDSGEVPSEDWISSSIRSSSADNFRMDDDWDDVEVLSVSDEITDAVAV